MEANRKILSTVAVLSMLMFVWSVQAQHLERTLMSNAGTQVDAGNVSLEWSLGEGIVADFKANEYRLSQGFHQGVGLINKVTHLPAWAKDISIFPNPVSHDLFLLRHESQLLQIEVFNTVGQLVSHDSWNANIKKLNVQSFSEGIYLILFSDRKGASAGYKFIKQ
jgi:hypothetical protein